ncbi:hypothetical protein [Peribacillus sp. SCS-155]|uniref:hypothetical protein n=1 Tax=Peribacillus sedimenti TaxID=3115297 RepID=UPI003905959D
MNKSTIQAFAAGIIFSTAVIFGVQTLGHSNSATDVTITEAKELLEGKGYEVARDASQNKANTDDGAADPPTKSNTSTTPEKKISEHTQAQKQQSSDKDGASSSSYSLQIKAGMTTGDIAELLYKERIINDEDAFQQYMNGQNLNEKIQIGIYVVTKDMTISQIAKTITK